MRGYMFRNRWGALLFVGLVLAGVAQLVGTGKGDGAIERAKGQLVEQKAEVDALAGKGEGESAKRPLKVEFANDDELIDPAVGEDPTPIDQRSVLDGATEEVPHDTVILVPRESADEAPQTLQ